METAAVVGVGDGDNGELLVYVMASVVIAGDGGCRSVAYNMTVRARAAHSSSAKASIKEQTL
ncbi:hypothetical protein Acr_16g0006090 [Actinidia rufa]|uniref:Uncharacterized protein n=1 Tax=Actinidia rufa TaxID=165716 RepID=A0A7J0FZ56_9ERIC|nr:hypothetical protein Acr_16g0006090 [Actinidia rufa]